VPLLACAKIVQLCQGLLGTRAVEGNNENNGKNKNNENNKNNKNNKKKKKKKRRTTTTASSCMRICPLLGFQTDRQLWSRDRETSG